MKHNERGLPVLDRPLLDLIFGHVYEESPRPLDDQESEHLVKVLLAMASYNHRYRPAQYARLFDNFERTVGPMERNSEGTDKWLALGLAVKELYGMRTETLEGLLRLVTVRK